ncbi:hypothetical protein Q7P37_010652 [Cladosporium fusiforme]
MQPSQLYSHALHYAQALQAYLGLTSQPSDVYDRHGLQSPSFAFSDHWQVLGPFQIGTREAIWSADPLEYYGGFHALDSDHHLHFPGSLPFNATVVWSDVTAKLNSPNPASASAEMSVDFPDIDWSLLQQVYGWAALQWQAWARGEIIVQSEDVAVLALHAKGILEYWIDDEHYFGGDFYSFGRAPAVLRLKPGTHRIDVRLVRDVRAMGGITANPAVEVQLELQPLQENVQISGDVLIADRVESAHGLLASDLASVVLINNMNEDIFIEIVRPEHSSRNMCETLLVHEKPVKIMPGQSRPVAFRVSCIPSTPTKRVEVEFFYRVASKGLDDHVISVTGFPATIETSHQPQKITYLHPGGMVSYAVLRPPSVTATKTCNATSDSLPIILALHGAGLEADNRLVRHSLDPLPDLCAWVLFPTGVTPWSGDDWHNWGFADVQAAVDAIPGWIEQNSWTGPGVDTNRWLVTGHSNGGQGTWYLLTHHPDKVMAAAPLSGYTSIQNYVPYEFWRPADPARSAIVQASLNSYRHELLLGNAKSIPILQQHGSADDNVPPYHSRLMHQLLPQSGADSTYFEMEGKPHYWDGVMTTNPLTQFFKYVLARQTESSDKSSRIGNFTVTSANPGDTGPKNGIQILGLTVPGRLGSVEALFGEHSMGCSLQTSNVRDIFLSAQYFHCDRMVIDGDLIKMRSSDDTSGMTVRRLSNEQWEIVATDEETTPPQARHGRQMGPIDAILRTQGALQIVPCVSEPHEPAAKRVALQISRNLCQYFNADTESTPNHTEAANNTGNVISVMIGTDVPQNTRNGAIKISPDRVTIRDALGTVHTYRSRRKGLGAVFLRPLPDEKLELVVWGADEASLRVAARLVPTLTGTGVPDFVIVDSDMLWKGVEGTLAMGFFDSDWNVSLNAFLS